MYRGKEPARNGFTLIELLVVIFIILVVSIAALPVVLPAINHRQVSEAARILQGALVGAHDSAIHSGAPAGIRLLPDPAFSGINPTTGMLDATFPLAANRFIPIEPAPDYSEGAVSIIKDQPGVSPFPNATAPPWPIVGGGLYPYPAAAQGAPSVLMIEECPVDTGTGLPNEPTSWFWNIRVGEKIQIGNAGRSYTVVGPITTTAAGGNPDWFVNDGLPGSTPQLQRMYTLPNGGFVTRQVEYLFLVNGLDDDVDGFVDDGWDGVDNNLNGIVDDAGEWTEAEQWQGSLAGGQDVSKTVTSVPGGTLGFLNQPYAITRRPVPSSKGREIALPSGVVIDLTTWSTTGERSRLPVVALNGSIQVSPSMNQNNGYVEFLVNPDGTVVTTTLYSSPSSSGLSSSFFHFWLAERTDVTAPIPNPNPNPRPTLPVGLIPQQLLQGGTYPPVPRIKGEYRLVTVFSRSGQITTNDNVPFDNPTAPQNGSSYNFNFPFLQAQQGIAGGQ